MLTEAFARNFTKAKADFVSGDGDRSVVHQTGAAYLPDTGPLPWPTGLDPHDSTIEMFIASPDGSVSPAGDDEAANAAWLPVIEAFTARVTAAAHDSGIRFSGDAYVTASVTAVTEVVGVPHFDDDMFNDSEGVGLVAIAGRIGGPRVACTPIECASLRSPTQVLVDDAMADRFSAGDIDQHTAVADRIVVFPQFAQLHAGPPLAVDPGTDSEPSRQLLVFRVGTIPHAGDGDR